MQLTHVRLPRAAPEADMRPHAGTYTDSTGSLKYTLYRSSALIKRPPLFVMLHGASQSASDFAIGTRMHEVVDECGGMVLFPEQSRSAHPLGSWNWYDTKHQSAGHGEPSMLAGLTRQIIQDHGADRRRVYVAGMSAGGAMAVILGQAYPNLFAAVGVHSGIPAGAAHDLMSALQAMTRGPSVTHSAAMPGPFDGLPAVPTIVFHGDRDQTVHPLNAAAVLAQALRLQHDADSAGAGPTPEQILMPGSREVTLVKHVRRAGRPDAEMWMVHGSGHAWNGGNDKASYTDSSGPDASREMLRFFMKQSLTLAGYKKLD